MKKRIALFIAYLFVVVSMATAQVNSTSGVVTDAETGEPLIGATVKVQGTNMGVLTDIDGNFNLKNLPAGAKKLEISYMGMIAQVVNIKPNMKIALEPDQKALQEVMVVAYGTSTKAAFTGSAKVLGAEELDVLQSSNALDALAGHAAGVEIFNATGDPTNANPTIRIRGIGSINAGTEPLIVVDGTPYGGDMNTINSSDIETMTVLKDAAASSLYGSRGANGVIIITTKKGKIGDGARVNLDAKWGSNSRAQRLYKTLNDPRQYYEAYYKALYNYGVNNQGLSANEANLFANKNLASTNNYGLGMNIFQTPEGQLMIGTNGKMNPNAVMGRVVKHNGQDYYLTSDDWMDEAYHNSLRQEYNVNISNGTDKGSFYASFGYLNNQGITVNSDYERINGRLKADLQAKPWLRVGANLSYTHYNANTMTEDGSNSTGNIFEAASKTAPVYPVFIRDAYGNKMIDKYGLTVYDYADGSNAGLTRPINALSNALGDQAFNKNFYDGNAMSAMGFADVRFAKDFKFTSTNTVNFDEIRGTMYTNPYYGQYKNNNGMLTKQNNRTLNYTFQQLLSWGHQFDKHDVDIMVGHEWYRERQYTLAATKSNMFSADNLEFPGAIVDGQAAGGSTTDYNTEGFFSRAQYNYANKYFASASYRRDASSRFHPDHRWGNFYSVGGSWVISDESFMEKAKWINFLKYKLSYGSQGNDNIGNYLYTDLYQVINSGGQVAVQSSKTKGNENITWETNGEMNTGIEFGLFKSRLNGGIEYFWRKTSDMLYPVPMSVTSGFERYWDNIGDLINHGVEVELNADIIRTKNITWNVGVNLTHYKNKVTYMPECAKTQVAYDFRGKEYSGYSSGNAFIGEGLSLNSYYMPIYAGIYTEESADKTGKAYDAKYQGAAMWWKDVLDADGNPTGEKVTTTTYSSATRYITDDKKLPAIYGGLNTHLEAYGFDLVIDFAYQIGGKAYDYDYEQFMTPPSTSVRGMNLHADLLNAWSPENTGSNIPRLQFNDNAGSMEQCTRFLTKANYLSLQNVVLGYNLPKKWMQKIKVEKIRLYANANNVFLWSARRGFDPRVGNLSRYSPIRTISGGVNVTF